MDFIAHFCNRCNRLRRFTAQISQSDQRDWLQGLPRRVHLLHSLGLVGIQERARCENLADALILSVLDRKLPLKPDALLKLALSNLCRLLGLHVSNLGALGHLLCLGAPIGKLALL